MVGRGTRRALTRRLASVPREVPRIIRGASENDIQRRMREAEEYAAEHRRRKEEAEVRDRSH
ncbi:hypothetical protein GCM10023085_56990 [Actinomadura viridis]